MVTEFQPEAGSWDGKVVLRFVILISVLSICLKAMQQILGNVGACNTRFSIKCLFSKAPEPFSKHSAVKYIILGIPLT